MTLANNAVPPMVARVPEFGVWVGRGAVMFAVGDTVATGVVETGIITAEVVTFG